MPGKKFPGHFVGARRRPAASGRAREEQCPVQEHRAFFGLGLRLEPRSGNCRRPKPGNDTAIRAVLMSLTTVIVAASAKRLRPAVGPYLAQTRLMAPGGPKA